MFDHEFAGQTADVTNAASESGEQRRGGPDALAVSSPLISIEQRFAQDRCQHHQEGELRHGVSLRLPRISPVAMVVPERDRPGSGGDMPAPDR